MKFRKIITTVLLVLTGVVLAGLVGVGGYALGATRAIHGCVNSKTHVLTVVSKCPSGTSALSWNQTGPAGPSTAGAAGLHVKVVTATGGGGIFGTATALCPAAEPHVIGGGAVQTDANAISESAPVTSGQQGWTAEVARSPEPQGGSIKVYAICAR